MPDLVVLQPQHKEQIVDLEKSFLGDVDDIRSQMKMWDARWRSEALDHYLNLGWSFGHFENDQLKAYVLAQPFVFFKGWTQTLWVEWLSGVDQDSRLSMVDTVYRWARDKHFQALVFEGDLQHSETFMSSPFSIHNSNGLFFIKTSKMK